MGEYVNNQQQRWEIQLKGAGLTPYSRFADGRAVLRSSIREYLMSEAMHYLGIPTTRAATLIGSEHHKVVRDEFYNGNARHEKAAVVCRLSPSFIRFGSFEVFTEYLFAVFIICILVRVPSSCHSEFASKSV